MADAFEEAALSARFRGAGRRPRAPPGSIRLTCALPSEEDGGPRRFSREVAGAGSFHPRPRPLFRMNPHEGLLADGVQGCPPSRCRPPCPRLDAIRGAQRWVGPSFLLRTSHDAPLFAKESREVRPPAAGPLSLCRATPRELVHRPCSPVEHEPGGAWSAHSSTSYLTGFPTSAEPGGGGGGVGGPFGRENCAARGARAQSRREPRHCLPSRPRARRPSQGSTPSHEAGGTPPPPAGPILWATSRRRRRDGPSCFEQKRLPRENRSVMISSDIPPAANGGSIRSRPGPRPPPPPPPLEEVASWIAEASSPDGRRGERRDRPKGRLAPMGSSGAGRASR